MSKNNEVLQTIKSRYSCRGYTGELVDKELLQAIGEAALASPSSRNTQHWRVIIINNKALMDEMNDAAMAVLKADPDQSTYERIMERGGRIYYNAPCMVLVLKTPDAHDEAPLDCGILAQSVALAAQSLGLGNVIARMCETAFVSDRGEEFKQRVGWEAGYTFGIGILIGYPDNKKDPHELEHDKLRFVE